MIRKRTAWVLAVVLLPLVGLVFWVETRASGPRAMSLRVSGPAGVKVSATLDADGKTITEEKSLPCEFTVTAAKLDFQVTRRSEGDGQVQVEVHADGRMWNRASALREISGRLEFEGRGLKESSISGH